MSAIEQSSYKKHAFLWGAIFWVIYMSMLTPILSLTIWIASIPATMLYVKTNRKLFGAIAGATLIMGMALSGGFSMVYLWIALAMIIPGVAIAEAYRRGYSARKSVTVGVVSYLSVFLLSILIATLMGGNVTQLMSETIRESISMLPEAMRSVLTDETVHEFIQLIVMMIPFYFIATSVFLAALTHTVSRRIANRTGSRLPMFPPIRDWKLPRSFVWYYLIGLFADLFIAKDTGSFAATVIVNLVPLFMVVFAVQGISFLFFVGYMKGKMWIPWVGVAAVLFISPLFSAFSLLGVFDTAFPIRDRIRKS